MDWIVWEGTEFALSQKRFEVLATLITARDLSTLSLTTIRADQDAIKSLANPFPSIRAAGATALLLQSMAPRAEKFRPGHNPLSTIRGWKFKVLGFAVG